METKVCSNCGIEKPLTEFFTRGKNIDKCKKCIKKCFNLEYRENNKEKINEYSKKYYENNREKFNERKKKYRKNNSEKLNEYSKKYYENNREKLKEKSKEICKKNRYDITVTYMASVMGIPVNELRKYPELIETKRILTKIKRELKNH